MTKILLVEDDKSLREIYGVRLLAEGYDIVSAGDGEEALAVAIREKPELIISDVMMPKISGFEMLDLLRGNDTTKNIKVIMMTALSSDQQRERGEKLGADRYLVKSQVGIEDLVATVHEVLGDKNQVSAPSASTVPAQPAAATIPTSVQSPVAPPAQLATPTAPAPNQSPVNPLAATLPSAAAGVSAPALPSQPINVPPIINGPVSSVASAAPTIPAPIAQSQPVSTTPPSLPPIAPPASNMPAPAEVPSFQPREGSAEQDAFEEGEATYHPAVDLTKSAGGTSRVIQPTNDTINPKIDINNLLAKEDAAEMGLDPNHIASANPADVAASTPPSQLDEANAQTLLDAANAQVAPVSDNPTITFPSQQ